LSRRTPLRSGARRAALVGRLFVLPALLMYAVFVLQPLVLTIQYSLYRKQKAGKLDGPPDLAERVRDLGFRELPVTHAHVIAAGRLPVHHRDPFDRMLVAQAAVEGLTLATRDTDIQLYDVDLLNV
jgi:ABC-type sugar transport system permease subunit